MRADHSVFSDKLADPTKPIFALCSEQKGASRKIFHESNARMPTGCIRVHKLTPYRWGTQSHESRERIALSFSSTILYTTDLAGAPIHGILTGSIRVATSVAISARSNFGSSRIGLLLEAPGAHGHLDKRLRC